jgi:uncharacterized protein
MRIVLDTNVLIDGFADEFSAQAKLIDAIRAGKLAAVISKPLEREYRKIMRRLLNDDEYQSRVEEFIVIANRVELVKVDVVIDDEEDLKIIETATGGDANFIVSNDRHLLDIGEVGSIKIVTPSEAWASFEEEQGSGEWSSWAKGLGIG